MVCEMGWRRDVAEQWGFRGTPAEAPPVLRPLNVEEATGTDAVGTTW